MDPFDRAQEQEQKFRDKALQFQQSKMPTGESAELYECGAEIPLKRRLAIAGVKTCIDCQKVNEKQRKLYGR